MSIRSLRPRSAPAAPRTVIEPNRRVGWEKTAKTIVCLLLKNINKATPDDAGNKIIDLKQVIDGTDVDACQTPQTRDITTNINHIMMNLAQYERFSAESGKTFPEYIKVLKHIKEIYERNIGINNPTKTLISFTPVIRTALNSAAAEFDSLGLVSPSSRVQYMEHQDNVTNTKVLASFERRNANEEKAYAAAMANVAMMKRKTADTAVSFANATAKAEALAGLVAETLTRAKRNESLANKALESYKRYQMIAAAAREAYNKVREEYMKEMKLADRFYSQSVGNPAAKSRRPARALSHIGE